VRLIDDDRMQGQDAAKTFAQANKIGWECSELTLIFCSFLAWFDTKAALLGRAYSMRRCLAVDNSDSVLVLSLRLTTSRLKAAIEQTVPHAAKLQSMPMAEAAVPIKTLPKDHKPRSIKNRLSTRPNKLVGVVI
jgi:hypothetical protein